MTEPELLPPQGGQNDDPPRFDLAQDAPFPAPLDPERDGRWLTLTSPTGSAVAWTDDADGFGCLVLDDDALSAACGRVAASARELDLPAGAALDGVSVLPELSPSPISTGPLQGALDAFDALTPVVAAAPPPDAQPALPDGGTWPLAPGTSLFVAQDPDTQEVALLAFSGATDVFVRDDASWLSADTEDERVLDGAVWTDVALEFVALYDDDPLAEPVLAEQSPPEQAVGSPTSPTVEESA